MRELDGKDDGLLERLLGGRQPGHVAPLDVGLLHHDGVVQLALHLLLLGIVVIGVSVRVCGVGWILNPGIQHICIFVSENTIGTFPILLGCSPAILNWFFLGTSL